MSEKASSDIDQTLLDLHQRFTTLEGVVESAVNDLRKNSRPGQKEREIANNLEAALEGNGRYVNTDSSQEVDNGR